MPSPYWEETVSLSPKPSSELKIPKWVSRLMFSTHPQYQSFMCWKEQFFGGSWGTLLLSMGKRERGNTDQTHVNTTLGWDLELDRLCRELTTIRIRNLYLKNLMIFFKVPYLPFFFFLSQCFKIIIRRRPSSAVLKRTKETIYDWDTLFKNSEECDPENWHWRP